MASILPRRHADVALVQAAIEAYSAELAVEQTQFYASAVRGRPQVRNELGRTVELRYRGQRYSLRVCCLGPHQYRVEVDGSRIEALIHPLGKFEYWLTAFGRRFHVVSVVQGLNYRIEVDGVSHSIDRDDGGVVHAPGPSVVVSIAVKTGRHGFGRRYPGGAGSYEDGDGSRRSIFRKSPAGDDDTPRAGRRWSSAAANRSRRGRTDVWHGRSRVVFGDSCIRAGELDTTISLAGVKTWKNCVSSCWALMPIRHRRRGCSRSGASSRKLRRTATKSYAAKTRFSTFLWTSARCFAANPSTHDPAGGEAPSTEAYLFSYLRMLETQGEGLPPAFVDALSRALAHYGVKTLDRSPELEESLLWIYKSHQRVERQVDAHSGLAGTSTGTGRRLAASLRTSRSVYLAGPDDLHHPRAVSLRQRPCPRTTLSLLRPGAVRDRRVNRSMPRWKIISPILPPIQRPRTVARE